MLVLNARPEGHLSKTLSPWHPLLVSALACEHARYIACDTARIDTKSLRKKIYDDAEGKALDYDPKKSQISPVVNFGRYDNWQSCWEATKTLLNGWD